MLNSVKITFFGTPCSLTGEASIQRNTNTDSSTVQSQIWATNTNGWNGGIGQQEGWWLQGCSAIREARGGQAVQAAGACCPTLICPQMIWAVQPPWWYFFFSSFRLQRILTDDDVIRWKGRLGSVVTSLRQTTSHNWQRLSSLLMATSSPPNTTTTTQF